MLQDFGYAFRTLRKSPGFTLTAVFALALGIGANTAIFSVLNAVLLRPLPYRQPDRLVMIWEKQPALTGFLAERLPAALKNYLEWKRQSNAFEDLAALQQLSVSLTGVDKPEQLEAARVTRNVFSLFGVAPAWGRGFSAEETGPGRDQVTLISYSLARRRFGQAGSAAGKVLTLNGRSYTVAGVLPAEFHLPAMWEGFDQKKPEVWIPMAVSGTGDADLENRSNFVFGRLRPGVSLQQARSEMNIIGARLQRENPKLNKGFGVNVFPLAVEDVGPTMNRTVVALQVAVGLVLLIACANVSNLLLTKAAARGKELALRVALGATRVRLMRQMLSESLLLSCLGGVGGLLIAMWALQVITSLAPEDSYHLHELSLDIHALGFTSIIVIASSLIFGFAPLFHLAGQNLNESLARGGRSGSAGVSNRLRSVLVIAELSLALILLIGAGLMIRSLTNMLAVNPGFQAGHLLTLHVKLPESKYAEPQRVNLFCDRLLEKVSSLGGVRSVTLASALPVLDSISMTSVRVEGQHESKDADVVDDTSVSEGYFATLRETVLRGRTFSRQEAEDSKPQVTVVNEALARQLSPGGDAVGKVLLFGSGANQRRVTVIGVVAGTHQMGLDTSTRPEAFLPSRRIREMALMVLADGDPLRLAGPVSSQVWSLDKDQPVSDIRTMEEHLSQGKSQRRFTMLLFASFAGLALILAAIGVYGVLSYIVSQRMREIGIRMALGADRKNIIRLIVSQGLGMTVMGVAIGAAAAFGLTRLLQSLIFGISATDPVTFATVTMVLLAVAFLASYIPALRASRVDSTLSLRVE